MRKKGLPEIVWIGASHIRRFKEWSENEDIGIKAFDRDFLEMAGWAASGGAKFSTFIERLNGTKLPYRQRHQGDQWSNVIVRHPFPYGVALSMGSNDVADAYRVLMRMRLNDKKAGRTGTESRWFKWAFKQITKHAKENVKYLKLAYPNARFFFINILDRPDWPPVVCRLAKWIGDYMRSELGYTLIDANCKIHRGHILERDLVHLNRIGYHRFYAALARPISTAYMQDITAYRRAIKAMNTSDHDGASQAGPSTE